MNLFKNADLMEQLAVSYALGTLRGGARRRFEALARGHAPLRAAALVWQSRMSSLAELQPEVVPSAAVWTRIENLLQAQKQAAAMVAARASTAAHSKLAPPAGWWINVALWRGAATAGVVAAVVATLAVSNVKSQAEQLANQVAMLSGKLAATPDIQYVAVLADEKASASVLVTFDPKKKTLLVKRVGSFGVMSDKSLQLWALPPGAAPKSLGVLGNEAVMRLTAAERDVREVPTLAISLEPKGGAPTGSGPSGPVLFKGALLETSQ